MTDNQMNSYYKDYYKEHGEAAYLGETYEWTSRFRIIGDILFKHMANAPHEVLDVGCGDATFSKLYPKYQWSGVDINIEKTGDKPIVAHAHDINVTPYPFNPHSFEMVVCSEVLEHLWDPRIIHREAHRLLMPNGHYVISTPNFNWLANILENSQRILFNPEQSWTLEHIRHYTPQTHIRDLQACGFRIVNVYGADHHFCPVLANVLEEVEKALSEKHSLTLPKGVLHSYVRSSMAYNSHTVIIEAQKVTGK
jgi:SAM-dependent methyltransferase